MGSLQTKINFFQSLKTKSHKTLFFIFTSCYLSANICFTKQEFWFLYECFGSSTPITSRKNSHTLTNQKKTSELTLIVSLDRNAKNLGPRLRKQDIDVRNRFFLKRVGCDWLMAFTDNTQPIILLTLTRSPFS